MSFKELYFRGEDVPKIVEEFIKKGINAIGITGNDLFQEFLCNSSFSCLKVLKRIPWIDESFKFKKPALCLLGYQSPEKLGREAVIAVNRKYESLSLNFLETLRQEGLDFKIQVLNGSTEIAVWDGLADYCVDIVCTGSTLEKFELKVLKRFFESDWVVLGIDSGSENQLEKLQQSILERIFSRNPESYTFKIFSEKLSLKKFNEECFEVLEAAGKKEKTQIIWETADLLYFLSIILSENQVKWQEVWNELRRRELEK